MGNWDCDPQRYGNCYIMEPKIGGRKEGQGKEKQGGRLDRTRQRKRDRCMYTRKKNMGKEKRDERREIQGWVM